MIPGGRDSVLPGGEEGKVVTIGGGSLEMRTPLHHPIEMLTSCSACAAWQSCC